MIEVSITEAEDLEVTISPTNALGKPSAIQAGSLAIVSDNPGVIADGVMDPVNPLTMRCVTAGTGTATLTVSADADLGDGVETISETIQLVVNHVHATNLGVSVHGVPKP